MWRCKSTGTEAVKGTGQDSRSPEKNSLSERESPASLQDLAESLLCRLAFTNAMLKREGPEITVGDYCTQVLRLADDGEGGISSRGTNHEVSRALYYPTEFHDCPFPQGALHCENDRGFGCVDYHSMLFQRGEDYA